MASNLSAPMLHRHTSRPQVGLGASTSLIVFVGPGFWLQKRALLHLRFAAAMVRLPLVLVAFCAGPVGLERSVAERERISAGLRVCEEKDVPQLFSCSSHPARTQYFLMSRFVIMLFLTGPPAKAFDKKSSCRSKGQEVS